MTLSLAGGMPIPARGLADLPPHRQEWLLWRWASTLDWDGVDDLVRDYAAWGCDPTWMYTRADDGMAILADDGRYHLKAGGRLVCDERSRAASRTKVPHVQECEWHLDNRGYRLTPGAMQEDTMRCQVTRWIVTLLEEGTTNPLNVPRKARCPLPDGRDLWPAPADPDSRLGRIRRRLLDALGPRCHACDLRPGQMIDHDHLTGLVRGLVCKHCNQAVERCVHVAGCRWGDYLDSPPAWPLGIQYPRAAESRSRDRLRIALSGLNPFQ